MCGRFAQVFKHDQLQKLMQELRIKDLSEQIEINYNLAPTQSTAAILCAPSPTDTPLDIADITRYIGFFRWGLIPSWAKEIGKYSLINIRSETIMDKPTFKSGLIRRRLLIPANGFYEWRKPDKKPFFIHSLDEEPILMAGIYDSWLSPDGSPIPSCAIITCSANSTIRSIHDRMPVILNKQNAQIWLDPALTDSKDLTNLLMPSPDGTLVLRPVSSYVNNVRNQSPRCWTEEKEMNIW